ncbi:glutamic acid-rich protein isoform X2 [Lingula anatina]|uniref:Glutamic acid-rich protein isoform X2 n=1 Tax=Lingula anatina TaxID=7574 RepID=A0A1S3H201_LINAN|nr:glutamic acid-rich protein isoform X2 [Lingula anatina]|eukprot:XP_013379169.1 glutamic acid-rich protein isoform X2 [Lingula anatina]
METPGKKPGMSSKRKQKQSPSYSINSSKSKLNSSLRLNRSTRVNSSAVKTKNRQLAAALGRKSQELEFLKEEFCELRNEHHELKVKALRFHRIAQVTNENIEEVVVGRVQERMCDVSALLNKVSNQLLGAVKLLGTAVEMTTDPKRKSLETLCSNRASSLGANKSDDDSPVIAVPNPKRSIYYDAGSKNPAGRVPQKSSTIPLKPKLSTPAVDIHPAALSAVAASVNDVAGNLHEMSVIVEQSFMGEKMDTLDMNKVNVLDTVEDGENLPEEEVPQEEPNPTSKTSSSLPAPTAPTSENPGSPGKCDADMQNMTVYLDEQMDFTECISVPVGLASFISANSESAEKSVKAEEAEEQKEGRLSSPEDKEDSEDEMDKLKKKLKAMQNVKVFVNDCSKTKTEVSKSENDIATVESAIGKETSVKKTSTKERAKKKAKNQESSSESRPPCTELPPRESRKSRSKGRQEPQYRELSSDSESETPPSDTSLDSTTSSKSYGIVFNKPGKISFTAGRIDILNGDGKQKSRLPIKVPTKSRSKHKTSSKQRSRTKTKKDEKITDKAKIQDEPKSVFDYTGTPQSAEEKGVYDMSMNESVQQERLPLSKFRERHLTGTEEASTPSANTRSKPRALVNNQTSDPESQCEDKPARSRTKTIKPKEEMKLEPAAVKSRTKSKRKSSKSDYIEPRKTDDEDQEKSTEKSTCRKDAQTRPTGNSREQFTSQTKQAIEDTSVFDSPVRSKTQDDSLVDEENIVIEETPAPLGGSRSKTRLTSEEHVPSVATEKSPVAVKKSRTKTKLDGDNMVKTDHQEDQVGPVPTPTRVTKRGKEVKSKKKHRYTYCVEDLFSGDDNNIFHANNLEIPAPLSEDASEEPEREEHAVEGANHTSPRQDQASKMVQEKKNKKKHRYTYVRPDSGFDEDVAGKTDEKNISENQEGIVSEGQSNEKAKFEDRENTHNTQRTEEKCEMDEKIDGSCQEEPVQEEQSEDTSQDKDKEEKRKPKTKKRSRSVKPSEQEEERQNADDNGVKRPRRAAANVSLKEPSLGGKLRRGDPGTSSIYQGENIPLYKEKNKHKKDAKKRSTLSSITNIKPEHEVV